MNVEKSKNNFYKLTNVPVEAVSLLRHEIDPDYRFFERYDNAWYVHDKYVQDVINVANKHGASNASIPNDDYAILYLQPDAPDAILEVVYRKLAQLFHPDRGGDEEQFKRITAAYQRIKGS